MSQRMNPLGQPIGDDVTFWVTCPRPPQTPLMGAYCDVVPLNAQIHGDALFAAFGADEAGAMWTYLSNGPFIDRAPFDTFLTSAQDSTDPLFYAIINKISGQAEGFASFLRITPATGVVEVGFIAMSPQLQKTRVATEAIFLMMSHVFDDLGYRRVEWKCDNLNGPSKTAARRFGFTFDGMFPQATIYKGRNRDTAWFSILDKDWEQISGGFHAWLDPANFDTSGVQKTALATRPT
ncbi:GNAT family N-acetyltransferase [Yoonia sp. MH D7]